MQRFKRLERVLLWWDVVLLGPVCLCLRLASLRACLGGEIPLGVAAKHVPLLEVVTKVMASRSVVHPCGGSPVRTPISILRVLLSTRGHH